MNNIETAELPPLTEYRLADKVGEKVITARKLGESSSFRPRKIRWFEVTIYKTEAGEYVIHTRGCTVVEGEETWHRVVSTTSSFAVIELLTVDHKGESYIPRDSIFALAQAAQWDDDLRARYKSVVR